MEYDVKGKKTVSLSLLFSRDSVVMYPSDRSGGHLLDFLIEKHFRRGDIRYSERLEK